MDKRVLTSSLENEVRQRAPALPLYKKVAEIFDPNDIHVLDEEWMKDRCKALYNDRKYLVLSLNDLDSIVAAFDSFLAWTRLVLIVFIILVVFSTGSLSELTVTAGTFMFAFSFTFAETFKNVFTSYVFLFIRQPFDVGDRVLIGTNATAVYVRKMELLTTTFRQWDGLETTIPNYILSTMQIYNVKRSVTLMDEVTFRIDIRTSRAAILKLDEAYMAFLATQPNNFDPSASRMAILHLEDSRALRVYFWTGHRTNFQNGEHVPRRHDLCLALKVFLSPSSISCVNKAHTLIT